MKICYVDEAGCTGVLASATSDIQPIFIIAGLFLDATELRAVTTSLINLKQRFYPGLAIPKITHLGWMLREVKGAELRKDACDPTRNVRRHAYGYIDGILKIMEAANARLAGRIWVKGIGTGINGNALFSFSLQEIFTNFQDYLEATNDIGIVIVDSRLKHLNTPVAHSIFTQKFKQSGDSYPRIVELPAFSHSDNHAGLQLCDMVCSAIMTPIAVHTYCVGHVNNIHVRPRYGDLKVRFTGRCGRLQHRYNVPMVGRRGGFIVSDNLARRPGRLLFL